jgi:hypothetical protein
VRQVELFSEIKHPDFSLKAISKIVNRLRVSMHDDQTADYNWLVDDILQQVQK